MFTSQTVPVFWGWIGAGVARQSGKTLILNGKDDGEDARYCGTKKQEQQVCPGRWVKEMSLQWTKWTKETSLGVKKQNKKKNYIRGQRQVWESPQSFGQQVLTKYSGYWETKSIWLVVMSPAQRPSLLPISVCRDKVTLERSLLVMYSSSAKASLQPQPPNWKKWLQWSSPQFSQGIQNQYDSECREKVMYYPVEASNSGASSLQNG